jgi:hypothetical protein
MLDQLIQMSDSVYYNWDLIRREKKTEGTMTYWQLLQNSPLDRDQMSGHVTILDKKNTS